MAVCRNVYLFHVSIICIGVFFISVQTNQENTKGTKKQSTKLSDVVFVVLSQFNKYHAKRAEAFQGHFEGQLTHLSQSEKPSLYFTHKQWPGTGAWTIFSLLKIWKAEFADKAWVFVCEEETRVDLHKLEILLQKYKPSKSWFLGKALHDREPVIIHHFTDPKKLTYPDFSAGFLFSMPLIQRLADRWPDPDFRADFAIDPKHELASYVLMGKNGVKLTNVPELCVGQSGPDCVTSSPVLFPDCGPAIDKDDLFVAVKTCEKFHKDRVPVVKNTWAKETDNIEFYSETEDSSIPTVDLGVPNTERGHCGKTMAIMKRAVTTPRILNKPWLLIADDDTIIHIGRLRQLLSCYDGKDLVALGERYGYQVSKGYGYDYITGGGGMVFSMPVVQRLVDECHCGSIDSPDDMTIGMCLGRLQIPITHTPYLHQARPEDYSEDFLSHQIPVSFHKHWNTDPYRVYKMLQKYEVTPPTTTDGARDEL